MVFRNKAFFTAGRKLKHLGYVTTVSGPFGGFKLATQPDEITIHEFLSTFNDDFSISEDINIKKSSNSTLLNFVNSIIGIETEINEKMSSLTLADLINATKISAK